MAPVQVIYDSIAEKGWDEISGIITATDKEYRKEVFCSLSYGLVILPLLVHGQVKYALPCILTFLLA